VSEETAPLILTLAMDPQSFALFDGLRRRHFPPERNFIPAHLTLFHHLPGDREDAILRELEVLCGRQPPVALAVTGLRSLGRGVAYTLDAPDLEKLRGRLASMWRAWLTPQDRQGFRPHVTVQNKVTPAEAQDLLRALQATFAPFAVQGEGLHLWRYLGGPWRLARTFRFGGG
jgi:2'-5' RNA ligase